MICPYCNQPVDDDGVSIDGQRWHHECAARKIVRENLPPGEEPEPPYRPTGRWLVFEVILSVVGFLIPIIGGFLLGALIGAILGYLTMEFLMWGTGIAGKTWLTAIGVIVFAMLGGIMGARAGWHSPWVGTQSLWDINDLSELIWRISRKRRK